MLESAQAEAGSTPDDREQGRLVGRQRARRELAADEDLRSRVRGDVRGAQPEDEQRRHRRRARQRLPGVRRRGDVQEVPEVAAGRADPPADARRGDLQGRAGQGDAGEGTDGGRCPRLLRGAQGRADGVRLRQRGVAHPRGRRSDGEQPQAATRRAAHRSPRSRPRTRPTPVPRSRAASSAASQPNAYVAEFQQAADSAAAQPGGRPGAVAVRLST